MSEVTEPIPPSRLIEPEAVASVIDQQLPSLVDSLSTLLGRRIRLPSRSDREKAHRSIRKIMMRILPQTVALAALSGELDRRRALYALYENIHREFLTQLKIPVPTSEDALAVLLAKLTHFARPPRGRFARLPSFASIRDALTATIQSHVRLPPTPNHDSVLEEWQASGEGESYPALCRKFERRLSSVTEHVPRRFSEATFTRWADAYVTGASLYESRLRLLLALFPPPGDRRTTLSAWQKPSLAELQDAAAAHATLAPLASNPNRHVRNAIAHGHDALRFSSGVCTFRDRTQTITCSPSEFLTLTHALVFGALALTGFEPMFAEARFRMLAHALWRAVADAPSGPPQLHINGALVPQSITSAITRPVGTHGPSEPSNPTTESK